MTEQDEVYAQASAQAEKARTREQEVDELIHEIETSSLPDGSFSKSDLVPLIAELRALRRTNAERAQMIADLSKPNPMLPSVEGDRSNCSVGEHRQGSVHLFVVSDTANPFKKVLICARCGRMELRDAFMERPK